jgi:1-aminocyclopropane-1-carboxylate deaminase/D-cysteine desulfhydrase-like pyridoxal-dependent ACC family enzyme
MTIELTSRLVQWLATLLVGGRGYFIPVGGHNVLGALGYVAAALELSEQLHAKGIDAAEATLVFAAGSGTTLAGLLAGFALLDSPIRLLAVDVGALWKSFRRSIARLATNVCAALDNPIAFNPRQVPLVEGRFVGSRYGAPTSEAEEAIRTVARTEGILLDPVYTAKAFAGLLELVKGPIRPAATTFSGEHIIFLHTGGLPALFASLGEQNKTSGSG